ncbi:hypothetical protein SbBS512_A0236 (plasmid) [Shigella boydii CDC 3083-94]|uniref:Uncharacterized protein n=1 Tax=Shigella boydii serotype 18 (strain CDC 3083-94 / BS512) TaxID=344609 RepID=B2TT40_SHIB3|nr:hypothetical protein SbBS512_A0236 [Shigella boydii CDC 3083-94]
MSGNIGANPIMHICITSNEIMQNYCIPVCCIFYDNLNIRKNLIF